MKRFLLPLILLSVTVSGAMAQDSIRISGWLKGNTRFAKVVVKKFGVGVFDIAAVSVKDEKFSIVAPAGIEPGVYRFQYSQSNLSEYVDIIIDGREKEIDFKLDVSQDKRVPVFTQSFENKNWYRWKQVAGNRLLKIDLLQQLLAQYPDITEAVYRIVARATNKEITDFKKEFNLFVRNNHDTWAGAMVENTPSYFTRPRDLPQLQDYYRKCNYWKGVNTANPTLIKTPLYTELILGYLRYYMNPGMQFSETEMNDGLKNSVDTVMKRFGGNEQTRQFALKYLQLGFKEIANEKVLQYIDEKYRSLAEQCNDNQLNKEEFENRLASYSAMKPGTSAPDIKLTAADGKPYGLKDIPNKKLIVAFWASWCPNCEHAMPLLDKFVKEHPEYGAVAVSLDEDSLTFHKASQQYTSLIHTCDFRKWQGKAAKDYYIAASPTFILLDAERKVVGKYPGMEAVLEEINKMTPTP
jgi:thiol-disulfide isomerase/thioredoxin